MREICIADGCADLQPAAIRSFDLVDWIHKNCGEWVDPGKSSTYLPYKNIFEVLKKTNSEARAERITKLRKLKEAIAKAQ